MDNIINVFEKKGEIFTDSRTIAQETEKHHFHVLRTISGIIKRMENDSNQTWIECFVESSYIDASGKSNKEYLLTKRGFLLYIFNVEGYDKFKMAYIDRFEQMEAALRERQTTDWLLLWNKDKKCDKIRVFDYLKVAKMPILCLLDFLCLKTKKGAVAKLLTLKDKKSEPKIEKARFLL